MGEDAKVGSSRPGEVSIDSVTLISYKGKTINILPQCIGIDIFEDMFAPFINGILYLKDAQDLVNKLPIIGQEIVEIEYSTPQLGEKSKFKGRFAVYKLDDKTRTAERESIYTLHFVSEESITDLNYKVSRAYEGYPHDIVRSIVEGEDGLKSKKKLFAEVAVNRTKFISNFWNPIKNIQYACENATNEKNSPTFLFYENKEGFNFVTLDLLYGRSQPMHSFVWDNYTAKVEKTGSSRKSLEEDYKRILSFESFPGFDYYNRVRSGMYGSEIIYYDLTTHQYVHNFYSPNWSEDKHLNKDPLWKGSNIAGTPKSKIILAKQYYNNFDGYTAETANTKVCQKRQALIAQAEAYKINISVYGRPEINAGDMVFVDIPVQTQVDQINPGDQVTQDKVQSGNYLIGSVCHNISRKSYQCTMELIKESFLEGVYE